MSFDLTPGEVEWTGAMEYRFFTMDVTNYDDDAETPTVNGEPFNPAQAGMSRFQRVRVDVDPGATSDADTQVDCVALYDYSDESIRLYYGGTDGSGLSEVSGGGNEGAVVKITAIGR